MEKIRHSVALLTSAVLLFSLAGCSGGKTGTASSKSSAGSHTAGQDGSSVHESGESMDASAAPGSNGTASGPAGNSGGAAAASTKPGGNNSSNVKPPLAAAGTAQVKAVNGIPRLFVEGKQEQPVFFMPPSYSFSGNKQLDGQMKLAAKNNVSIYVIPYETDYHELDDIFNNRLRGMVQSVHSYKPEAKVILRLGIDGALSKYGLAKSEAMELNGKATNSASLASEKWYGAAKTVLGNIVSNVKKDEFLNKYVIGYEYLGGDTGEWFGPGYWDGSMDTSESNRRGFEKYLKEKYKTDAAIRSAWGSGSVTLSGARLPDHTKLPGIGNESAQAQNVNNGQMLLTSKENQLYVDYLDYTCALRSDILAGFAETIKKACSNEKLAITYYGYHFDTPTASSSGFGVAQLLKSPHVDVLSGPLSYGDRSSGGVGAYMSFIDSVTAAGKMWFDEGDYRSPVHTTRPELEYPSSN